MKIVKDCKLEVFPLPGQINYPNHSLTLLVKSTLNISHKSIAKLADEQLPASADEYYPEDDTQSGSLYYASDFAFFKPHADILLSGKCHVPGGKAVAACPVSIQVGQYKKTLNIFGSRYWQNIYIAPKTTTPEPFREMDLRYERSFGGEGFELNPVGRGASKSDISIADSVLPVPNIQTPDNPVTSPFTKSTPANFGPLKNSWGLRQNKLGTYGKQYLKTRWPWYPEDFDWSHFNAAPVDQQIKGYLRGDETLIFENFHPKFSQYETQLPGIRPRCFSRKQNPQTGKRIFEEINLKLDTLWVDMEKEQLVLTWRGWMEIADEDFDEVKHIFLTQESVFDSRASIESCYERFKKAEAAEDVEFSSTAEKPETITKKKKPSIPAISGIATVASNETAAADNISLEIEEVMKQTGIDLDELPPEVQADIQKRQNKILQKDEHSSEQSETQQQLKSMLAEMDLDLDNLPELSPTAEKEKVRFFNELGIDGKEIASNAEINKMWTVLGAALPKMGLNPENLEPLIQHIQPEIDKIKAQLNPETVSKQKVNNKSEVSDKAASSNIQQKASAGESFAGQNLSGENFSGMDLQSCDFSSAILTGADFSNANLANANFDYANVSSANFKQANLSGATLNYIDARAADFSESNCDNTILNNATFEGALAENSSWKNAQGEDSNFVGAKLNGANFQQSQLLGADFESAEIAKANFSFAMLANATFERANAVESNFHKADITGLRASLSADFSAADFSQATGKSPIFSSSKFHQTNFTYCDIPEANFDRANLQGANLSAANLKQARFIKANLTGSRLIKSNLMQATVERANMFQADIRGSNCYEVEFLNALMDELKTDSANLTATKLEV